MNKEISVMQYLKKMLSMIWLVAILTVLVASAMFAYSKFVSTPMYTSSAKMFVSNKVDQGTGTISSADMVARSSLVNTYAQIIKSNTLMTKVCDKIEAHKNTEGYEFLLDAAHTPKSLAKAVVVKAIDETEVFNISIDLADPAEAQFIVNAVTEFLPGIVDEKMKSSSVTLIDEADLPAAPSSPNVMRNTILGAAIGFIIAAAIIFFLFITDTVIYTEEQIEEAFENVTILGTIPLMHSDTEKSAPEAGASTPR